MYLHLGQDVVVRQQDIVGVFDMENTTVSQATRHYLRQAEKAGHVTYVSMELPKSYTVCRPPKRRRTARDGERVYISQIAPRTLLRRSRLMDTSVNIEGGPPHG